MENNLKSPNVIYKEYVSPFYDVSFKEFADYFNKKYEADKRMGYPYDSKIWLNQWFGKNKTKWIESANKDKSLNVESTHKVTQLIAEQPNTDNKKTYNYKKLFIPLFISSIVLTSIVIIASSNNNK